MAVVRWDPFSGTDELFHHLMPAMFGHHPRLALHTDGDTHLEWMPSADISETDKEYLVRAQLPAVRKEDVKVSVARGMLTIEGERKQNTEEKKEHFHRVESLRGSFARSFSLPENANADAIRCEAHDGVLTIHIPKKEPAESKPKQIKIE